MELTVLKVLAAIATAVAALWGFVIWDARQARAQFRSEDFEARFAALLAVALRSEAVEGTLRKIVAEAFANQTGYLLRAIEDLRVQVRDLDRAFDDHCKENERRLAALETRAGGRRSDDRAAEGA